jgi:lysophospholipase
MTERPRLFIDEIANVHCDEIANAHCDFFTRDDGTRLRYAIMEPRDSVRGTFLITPGRREYIEKKYSEIGSELLERGFRLIFFEWRGQGSSSRLLTGEKFQRDHCLRFDNHIDDLRAFYDAVVKPAQAGPLFVFGHSMGGFLILRWLAEAKPDVKGAVVTAPMLSLSLPGFSAKLCALAMRLGHGDAYAPWQHDYGDGDRRFTGNVLSHDPIRFALMEKFFAAHPEMMVGGVTWNWLHEALESMEAAHRPGYLAQIAAPVLMLNGSKDIVTPASKYRPFIQDLPQIEEHIIDGAKHDIMNEIEAYRHEAWGWIDRFLTRVGAQNNT